MFERLQLVVSITVGVVAAVFMESHHWAHIRAGTMLVLSILAGAVLFRLGRGMPTVDMDELEVVEVEELTSAFQIVTNRLVWIVKVTGVALVGLVGIDFIHKVVECLLLEFSISPTFAVQATTGLLAFVIALAFCRAVMLVRGDQDLVVVQSRNMVKVAQRRHARHGRSMLDEAEGEHPFQPPTGYGKLIEPS